MIIFNPAFRVEGFYGSSVLCKQKKHEREENGTVLNRYSVHAVSAVAAMAMLMLSSELSMHPAPPDTDGFVVFTMEPVIETTKA